MSRQEGYYWLFRELLSVRFGSRPRTTGRVPNRERENRVPSKQSDMNTRADNVVAQLTSQTSKRKKDPAAVARGRLGGQARARNTSPEARSNDAREAVNARWAAEKSRQETASA